MAFQRAILPAVLSWADKLVMIGKYWNTYLIACQCYIYYIAYTGAPSLYHLPWTVAHPRDRLNAFWLFLPGNQQSASAAGMAGCVGK